MKGCLSIKAVTPIQHDVSEVLTLVDVPIPQPDPGKILIRMKRAGISRPASSCGPTGDVHPFERGKIKPHIGATFPPAEVQKPTSCWIPATSSASIVLEC